MKKRTTIFVAISLFSSLAMVFVVSTSTFALSEEKNGAISQHCGTIKQSLKSLQKADARSRSYLGSVYETIITKFIVPMNLRLIDSGQPNATLTDLHSNILEIRKAFTSEYTSYSQSFEELLSINCQENPEWFYTKLQDTRKKRAELSSITTSLRNSFSEYLTIVRKLKNNMTNSNGSNVDNNNSTGGAAGDEADSGSTINNKEGGN